jgi:hypothetical protein
VEDGGGKRPTRRELIGLAAGVAAGAVFSLALYLLARWLQPESGLVLVGVFLIPAAASALGVLVAGIHGKGSAGKATMMAVAVVTAMIIGSAVFFREGVLCIVMASPIFYIVAVAGALIASALRTRFGRTPPALVIVLPLLLLPVEQQSAYPTMHAAIVTQIDINAPLATVWRDAVEIRNIRPNEQSWTFTHAVLRVPRPMDAQLVRRGDSVVRQATWQGGVRFYEVVTDWRPNQSVAWRFDIPEAAADRLLDEHLRLDQGYLHLDGGAYKFEPLSPTRTRLRLITRFSARTPWNAYALLWGEQTLGDIHRNVLNIVRDRAEHGDHFRPAT